MLFVVIGFYKDWKGLKVRPMSHAAEPIKFAEVIKTMKQDINYEANR